MSLWSKAVLATMSLGVSGAALAMPVTPRAGETDRALELLKTAVSFKTGSFVPDYHSLATESAIVLPWDREILVGDELKPNPKYAGMLPTG